MSISPFFSFFLLLLHFRERSPFSLAALSAGDPSFAPLLQNHHHFFGWGAGGECPVSSVRPESQPLGYVYFLLFSLAHRLVIEERLVFLLLLNIYFLPLVCLMLFKTAFHELFVWEGSGIRHIHLGTPTTPFRAKKNWGTKATFFHLPSPSSFALRG